MRPVSILQVRCVCVQHMTMSHVHLLCSSECLRAGSAVSCSAVPCQAMVMMDLYQNDDDDREEETQDWFEPALCVQKDAGTPGASPAPVGHTHEDAEQLRNALLQGIPASPVDLPRLVQGIPASSPSSHVEAADSDEDDDIWAKARGRGHPEKVARRGPTAPSAE